jgi:CHAT domain-containing protein
LRAAIFDKLLPALGHRTRLLLAPDGDLARLPFEVLPTGDGRRLIDDYQISYLSVGRDALRFGEASSGQPMEPLVAANPNFNLRAAAGTGSADNSEVTGRRSWDLRSEMKPVSQLPGTGVEGERIAEMLGVEPWLEGAVLEARLKACRSPRILHLATHGFFLKDQQHDLNKEGRGLGAMGLQVKDDWGRFSGPGVENPLLRSGLVLAGFNTWLKDGELPAEAEDGALTAEDVSGLDLLATELVVLSACVTALGTIQVGEGVMGLRRSFVLAGAKTLVMSLWEVDDLATAILMERFYDNLLNWRNSRGQPFGRSEALQDAQFYTRDVTVGQIRDHWLNAEMIERLSAGNLARQPDSYRPFAHPYYWGAFICQGDPNPLP